MSGTDANLARHVKYCVYYQVNVEFESNKKLIKCSWA